MYDDPQTQAEIRQRAEERARKHDAELADLRQDAERYRFLKKLSMRWLVNFMKQTWKPNGINMDDAIDREMAKTRPSFGRNPRTGEKCSR